MDPTRFLRVLSHILLILVLATGVFPQLSVTPDNVAVIARPESLILNCTTSSSTVALQWAIYQDDNLQTVISFNENVINTRYQGNFSIISGTTGGDAYHHLRLNDVQMQYGAMYVCVDAAVAQNAFAHVVVLASDPICTTNLSSNGSVNFGDIIHMACTVRYSMAGPRDRKTQWAPTMRWRGPEGNILQQDESIIGLLVQYSTFIEVTAEMNSRFFTCETFFRDPPSGEGQATNTPAYRYLWQSKAFTVEGIPRGGMSAGAIIGITLGSTAGVALIVFIVVILFTKMSKEPGKPKRDTNTTISTISKNQTNPA